MEVKDLAVEVQVLRLRELLSWAVEVFQAVSKLFKEITGEDLR